MTKRQLSPSMIYQSQSNKGAIMRRLQFQSIMTTNEVIDRPDLERNSAEGTDLMALNTIEHPGLIFRDQTRGSDSARVVSVDRRAMSIS